MSPRILLLTLLVAGCPKAPAAPPPDPPSQPEPPATVTPCPGDDAFVAFGWVPAAAEALTLIDMDAADLPAALRQLSAGTESPERQLPIRVAFALGQWTWQIPMLRTTLSRAGFAPAQLVHVMLPDGTSAWAWPQSCDLPTLTENLERGWGLALRPTPYGAAALAPRTDDGAPAFPYDFVAYGGSAHLLVPAGSTHAVVQRLAERPTDPAFTSLGERAAGLQAAPVRLAIHNRALLTPGAEANAEDSVTVHRVGADGWSGS